MKKTPFILLLIVIAVAGVVAGYYLFHKNTMSQEIIVVEGLPYTFSSATGVGVVVIDVEGKTYRLTGTRTEMGEWYAQVSSFEGRPTTIPQVKVTGIVTGQETNTITFPPGSNRHISDPKNITAVTLHILDVKEILFGDVDSAKSPNSPMTREQAFLKIREYVNNDASLPADTNNEFIGSLVSWGIPTNSVYQLSEPEIMRGDRIAAVLTATKFSLQIVRGSADQISKEREYWVFVWTRPGVNDERFTFYVEANNGTVALMTKFTSPD